MTLYNCLIAETPAHTINNVSDSLDGWIEALSNEKKNPIIKALTLSMKNQLLALKHAEITLEEKEETDQES